MKTACQWMATISFVICFLLTAGCSRNGNAQKQKFFESGNRYLQQGKYAEAAIQFQNAIQKDGTFAAGHFHPSKSFIEEKTLPPGFRECSETTHIKHSNFEPERQITNPLFYGHQLT